MPAFNTLDDRERNLVVTGQQRQITHDLTIANGAAATAWVATHGALALSVDMPASWTSADLTIELSNDGGTTNLGKLRDAAGDPVRLVIGTTSLGCPTLSPDKGWGFGARTHFRLVSTDKADETDENQGGARSLTAYLLL